MDRIDALPFREVSFDAAGVVQNDALEQTLTDLREEGVTDVLVFSHGWNNSTSTARRLYDGFFGLLSPLLAEHGAPDRTVGALGVYWPSRRWSDEREPAFNPAGAPELSRGGGVASIGDAPRAEDPPPPPDDETRDAMRAAFPEAVHDVDELVDLLRRRPPEESQLRRAHELVAGLLHGAAGDGTVDDGDGSGAAPAVAEPGRGAEEITRTYLQAMEDLGVVTTGQGGELGLADDVQRLWHGAQELARQATYWQMKNRAGVVGERGLGPFVRSLLDEGLRVTLIGHSFGARLVSFALRSLGEEPASVEGVVLLQGAFSQFTFADELPTDRARGGVLRGLQSRVAGPVVACHSDLDQALGTFYPLASLARGQDASALEELRRRWGAIGFGGHKPRPNAVPMQAVGSPYAFPARDLASVDVAAVVRRGRPPSGAHSDIVHRELAWVVLCAGGLVVSTA
ncbi:hypothetical protein ACI780_06940 [Geodermatophilus sp. SYSU D00814]